jgi:hypothetical protein
VNDILRDDWSGDMALSPDEARALGNCERYLEAGFLGHATVRLETSPGHFAEFPVALRPGAATLTDAQVAQLVAAQPKATDVAAHLDYARLAAAIASHFRVS